MGSFVDKKRAAPPAPIEMVRIVGYDPDTDIAGWAVLEAALAPTPRLLSAELIKDVYTSGRRSQSQASYAAGTAAASAWGLMHQSMLGTYVVVEGQEVYPDPDASRQKLVAQSNDLLHLALVAGSVRGVAAVCRCLCKVALPKEWKKQRTKPADHKHSISILSKHTVAVQAAGSGLRQQILTPCELLTELGRPWEHALDALGIALYGFDLLSTNRWGT
jgi:hypothetical protein